MATTTSRPVPSLTVEYAASDVRNAEDAVDDAKRALGEAHRAEAAAHEAEVAALIEAGVHVLAMTDALERALTEES